MGIRSKIPFLSRIANFNKYEACLKDSFGLEIGGPSDIFGQGGVLPIYTVVKGLDNCNINEQAGRQSEPRQYKTQFICDTTNLEAVPANSYDFVVSSHVLEHIANPFKAITEWLRVLKEGGYLLLVAPHKYGSTDHNRPVTSLEHLLEDFKLNREENDLSHLPEIVALLDQGVDPDIYQDLGQYKNKAISNNHQHRFMHHHVFDTKLLVKIFDHFSLQIISVDPAYPIHIIMIGKKLGPGSSPDNEKFLKEKTFSRSSPFPWDRTG